MAEKTIKPQVLKVIDFFAKRLQANGVVVSKIVVFGSHSQGAAGAHSDIDLIVVSESFTNKNLFQRAGMIGKSYAETVEKFLVPMDIIMESPEEFNPDFGIVVYAA